MTLNKRDSFCRWPSRTIFTVSNQSPQSPWLRILVTKVKPVTNIDVTQGQLHIFSVRKIWKRSLSNFKLTKLKMKKNMLNGKLVVKLGKNHMPITIFSAAQLAQAVRRHVVKYYMDLVTIIEFHRFISAVENCKMLHGICLNHELFEVVQ